MPVKRRKERWRPVPEWEGWYSVSDQGRVRSETRTAPHGRSGTRELPGHMLRPQPDSYGYPSVQLSAAMVPHQRVVHRLVWLAFRGETDLEVTHKNGDKTDNRIENLAAVPHKETCARGERNPRAKLTDSKVREIRRRLDAGATYAAIAEPLDVSSSAVGAIARGQAWTHVGDS